MSQQVEEDGWPLGLQPLNLRSVSISTFLSGSPSSFSLSSDLDTESTGSFFHDRSVTLGNLMGVSTVLELSRRSQRRDRILSDTVGTKTKSFPKSKLWCFGFCLCQKDNVDVIDVSRNTNIVPLGYFLEVERRAAQDHSRGQHSPFMYGADELTSAQPFQESSNLFVDGRIIPPTMLSPWSDSYTNEKRAKRSRGFITPCF